MARKKQMECLDTVTNQVKILTPEKFSMMIEAKVQTGLSYLESIMEFTNEYDVDHAVIKKLITPNISFSLKQEAIQLNLIRTKTKKSSKKLF